MPNPTITQQFRDLDGSVTLRMNDDGKVTGFLSTSSDSFLAKGSSIKNVLIALQAQVNGEPLPAEPEHDEG